VSDQLNILKFIGQMATIGKDLDQACVLLQAGEVVGIPTETVYGLAGDAMRGAAIEKIYAVKNRPATNPLIVHVAGPDRLKGLVESIPEMALRLMDRFWPGPLTLLLPKGPAVIEQVTAGQPRVAVRMPAHPLTLELLRMLPFALAAPSANPYGYISPTTAEHVEAQLGRRIQYILDGGACDKGIESTIVGFEQGMPVIYRKGIITDQDIKAVTGRVRFYETQNAGAGNQVDKINKVQQARPLPANTVNSGQHQVTEVAALNPHITSGMSLSHYAPKTPVFLLPDFSEPAMEARVADAVSAGDLHALLKGLQMMERLERHLAPDVLDRIRQQDTTIRMGVLSFQRPYFPENSLNGLALRQILLSPDGNLDEAAARLYEALHALDQLGLDFMLIETVPDTGIGQAINDRLGRAAVQ